MTEETSESTTPVETVEDAPTLESISEEFNVEEQTQSFQAQPEVQQQENKQFAPDPISNPEAFDQYAQQQSQQLTSLNDAVTQLTGKLQKQEDQLVQDKVKADVASAVATVNEKLGVDPSMAEIALKHEYENNSSFKKIWDNRGQNKAAFDKALGVVADKYSGMFAVKQDHQLTENQLAAKQSLQAMSKTPTKQESDWDNLSGTEFEAKWNEMRNG